MLNNLEPNIFRLSLPEKPGVYLFKDHSDRIIYVGKAKNLKKRVLSYFKSLSDLPHKTALMMKNAKGLEHIITATENEAFILESNLIKKHLPRYNIILRDDKQYPCLRLSIKETYPRLNIVRRMKKDGAIYFGPFSSAYSVRSTLKFVDRIFQLRKCKVSNPPKRIRPCLNGQLGRCLGPCTKEVSPAKYEAIVQRVKLFLEGRNPALLKQLKKDMESASHQLNFEDAARIRDMIKAVENTIERQNVVSPKMQDHDVIGLAQKDGLFQLIILFIRRGLLLGSRDYVFREKGRTPAEIMEAFIKQYYSREAFIPKQILVSEPFEDHSVIEDWLSHISDQRVTIHRPLKGEKYRITAMAVSNAENLLSTNLERHGEDLMEQVMAVLNLKKVPRIIEGLDISTLHGDMAVGAVVSFVDGLPHKSDYRSYNIKRIDNIDDYGMMAELAFRRLSSGNPPDLFIVDGGKGHLLAVKKVLDNFRGTGTPEVIAIAKADSKEPNNTDKIYLDGRKNPLRLKRDHTILLLLMRIRDEAHRRAIGHHRKRRAQKLRDSVLDHIPGIGPNRKRGLLKRFGTIDRVFSATVEDLASVPGISQALAQRISEFLSKEPRP